MRLKNLFLKVLVTLSCLFLANLNVNAYWEEHDIQGKYLFGYAGIGYVDSNGVQQLRMSEIESYHIPTNVQTLEVYTPTDNLSSQIAVLRASQQRAIVILDSLLFINLMTLNTPCGVYSWRHRLDFKAKFDNWLNLNRNIIKPENVAILVINTEVNNRCISYESLDLVTQYVKSKLPSIPTVAGYGRSDGAAPLPDRIPASLAGIAFFKYRIFNPNTDSTYQQEFAQLKSKLAPEQRIILVPDGFYDSGHKALGWPKWYLGYLAINYVNIALNDPKVVGMVVFLWSGFGAGDSATLGTRDLPVGVKDNHREVGCRLEIESPMLLYCQ